MSKAKTTLSLIAGALALGLAPDPVIEPAAWAADNLIVADGPKAGQLWSAELTPYAVEPLNMLAADSPHNRVSVRKSAQTGLTGVGIAWVGSIIAKTPAKAMVVFPTLAAVQDFNREKLTPTIEATEELRSKIRLQKSRSSQSSTALSKKFPGGSLVLTGANSAADLRSKTVRFLFCDEIDEWPFDLDGQGDPMEMADARQTSFHATGDYKKFEASTPTTKGESRIDVAFEAGDQRYWKVPCPHCGEKQRLEFGGKDVEYGLKFNTEWPYQAHYVCKHCGGVIEHHHKREMVLNGEWIADNPGPGRHPSYHIDALVSLLTTWDKIAEKFLKAKDDSRKLKAFVNLWLGQAWEERGDAPEWNRLFARREDYAARTIPPGGVLLTGAVDVQQDGLYYEIVAWGQDKQSWSIDVGFLEGDTADPSNPVWHKLSLVHDRRYQDTYGNTWPVDLMAIDSGFNTNVVYQWCRTHSRAIAIKGDDGWHKAAISSTPTKVDINWRGKRVRRGAELWHIGTWPLKAEFYANLRKEGMRDGQEFDPPGYCHFSETLHDDRYLKQVTAEHLKEREVKGRLRKEWVASGPNHYHDCRVYNMAVAVKLGVGVMSPEDWGKWVAERCVPPKPEQGDLLSVMNGEPLEVHKEEVEEAPKPKPVAKQPRRKKGGGFVNGWSA